MSGQVSVGTTGLRQCGACSTCTNLSRTLVKDAAKLKRCRNVHAWRRRLLMKQSRCAAPESGTVLSLLVNPSNTKGKTLKKRDSSVQTALQPRNRQRTGACRKIVSRDLDAPHRSITTHVGTSLVAWDQQLFAEDGAGPLRGITNAAKTIREVVRHLRAGSQGRASRSKSHRESSPDGAWPS